MDDINGDGEDLGSRARAVIRVRYLIRCKGLIQLQLELRARYNVRVSERFRFRITERCG